MVLTWPLCACAGVLQIRREKQRAKEQAEARAAERAARALEDKREQRVRQQRRKSEQDKWIEGVKEKKKHAVKHSALFGQEVRTTHSPLLCSALCLVRQLDCKSCQFYGATSKLGLGSAWCGACFCCSGQRQRRRPLSQTRVRPTAGALPHDIKRKTGSYVYL